MIGSLIICVAEIKYMSNKLHDNRVLRIWNALWKLSVMFTATTELWCVLFFSGGGVITEKKDVLHLSALTKHLVIMLDIYFFFVLLLQNIVFTLALGDRKSWIIISWFDGILTNTYFKWDLYNYIPRGMLNVCADRIVIHPSNIKTKKINKIKFNYLDIHKQTLCFESHYSWPAFVSFPTYPVSSCRAAAEGHRYAAVQPTWILPADAAWRHRGQHKGWKQLILWVCLHRLHVFAFSVTLCSINQITRSLVPLDPMLGFSNASRDFLKRETPAFTIIWCMHAAACWQPELKALAKLMLRRAHWAKKEAWCDTVTEGPVTWDSRLKSGLSGSSVRSLLNWYRMGRDTTSQLPARLGLFKCVLAYMYRCLAAGFTLIITVTDTEYPRMWIS